MMQQVIFAFKKVSSEIKYQTNYHEYVMWYVAKISF